MGRAPRTRKRTVRRAPRREPYERVLIVCEGARTEPEYFNELRRIHRLSNGNVVVASPSSTDPLAVVREAERLERDERQLGEYYDQVYCVFDRDRHSHFEEASQRLRGKGYRPGRSWPCFEYWILLHFENTRSPFEDAGGRTAAENCIRRLRHHLPGYRKGEVTRQVEFLECRVETAIRRARDIQRDAERTEEPNPSTEVHELVEYLRKLGSM